MNGKADLLHATGKTARQARWRAKRERSGFKRLDIWVPADRAASLQALVQDMADTPDLVVIGFRPEPGAVSECTPIGDIVTPEVAQAVYAEQMREAVLDAVASLTPAEVIAVASFVRSLATAGK